MSKGVVRPQLKRVSVSSPFLRLLVHTGSLSSRGTGCKRACWRRIGAITSAVFYGTFPALASGRSGSSSERVQPTSGVVIYHGQQRARLRRQNVSQIKGGGHMGMSPETGQRRRLPAGFSRFAHVAIAGSQSYRTVVPPHDCSRFGQHRWRATCLREPGPCGVTCLAAAHGQTQTARGA